MKIKTGIYKIKNLINNKVYIGSAVNIDRRWSLHQYHLSNLWGNFVVIPLWIRIRNNPLKRYS